MEVLVAVIALAGALLAAIATVALVTRFRSEPKGWLIAWSVTTASLSVSLGVIAVGYLLSFGPATFRIYQLTGSMLAPIWLAVGAVQLLARKSTARFASWLLGSAFTVIALVIMMVDPLLADKDFTKALPPGGRHWGLPPSYLLTAVHVVVALVLLAGLALAVVRWRGGDDYDADNMHALLVLGPTGLALVGSMSFTVPGMFAALLLCVTAAAVWYVVLRPLAPYEDEDEEDDEDDWEKRPPVSRRQTPDQPPRDVQVAGRRLLPEESRRSGLGDLVAEYRAGEQDIDYAARMQQQPPSGDRFGGPATGTFMAGEYGMPLADPPPGPAGGGDFAQRPPTTGQFAMPSANPATGEYNIPVNEFGRPTGTGEYGRPQGPAGPGTGEFGRPAGPATGEFAMPDPSGGRSGSLQPMPADQAFGGAPVYDPAAEQGFGGRPGYGQDPAGSRGYGQGAEQGRGPRGYGADQGFGGTPSTGAVYPGGIADQQGGSGRPSPTIFGLLTVFTLIDGTGERFDRLAEETVEAVRGAEPDTLIYACHSVKSAPLQRIVYELYRDEVAYTEHQRQPHVERFVRERQAMVLATNVIELNVNAAKVVPLPTAFRR
ncbi:putative quinol monooxygenase [Streptosporangium lutulentum]|uniref:Quinol monooxygenase YgiN n=1 Tax=Streptosporangium lutulentum TaxID=1461250 RepID=A0ABT9QKM4_9ACTN|nr:antibiotic biosynthesis monooxygenase [Streptosporangium lutulentum]MDP9847306.1 quinol monooxygenase YgiN [Streptosporangium lutulentum]